MLSVIVPVRNDPLRLAQCLAHLERSSLEERELIVVDDASTDGSPDVARERGARLLRMERRSGPAAARNRGAEAATGEFLVFVDADVCVHPDALERMAAAFAEDPGLAAVFGSYDRSPAAPQVVSQYKNLLHHYTHQQGAGEAGTFWAGCGGVRREVFLAAGGFDTRYGRPCIEDIELGTRLRRAGHRIRLDGRVLATHLKRWTLAGLVKSDVLDRALPWTALVLRERQVPDEVNLKLSQRAIALLVCLLALGAVALLAVAPWVALAWMLGALAVATLDLHSSRPAVRASMAAAVLAAAGATGWAALDHFGAWAGLPLGLLAAVAVLNRDLYRFFLRERGIAFLLVAVPLHLLYYLYSTAAFALGTLLHTWSERRGGSRS